MIKFLRRIRYDLMAKNKTGLPEQRVRSGKYFKYAIGEIVLVVIGILIALQINNWNENRKERLVQLQLLKELQYAAREDFDRGQHQLRRNKESLKSVEIILNQLESNLPYHDSLANHFNLAHSRWIAQIKDDAYKNLTDYGLNFMKNDTIKIEMTNLYGNRTEFLYKLDERFNLFYYQIAAPVLIDYFDKIAPFGLVRAEMIPLDYSSLSKNMKYSTILKSTKAYMEGYISWQENMILNGLNKLAHRLDSEIKYFD